MGLYEPLTQYVEIVELLDRLEARQFVIETSIATVDATRLTGAEREARLTPLREEHARLCEELEEAVARAANL